jgi:arsenate reductase
MTKQNVLFLSMSNSARSLMAEALMRDRAGGFFNVYSGGIMPRGVNPLTLRVLREIGIETEGLRSKNIEDYLGRIPVHYLFVVSAAADRVLPSAWQGVSERQFWRIEDPAQREDTDDDPLDRLREARDEISERIGDFLTGFYERFLLREVVQVC